MTATDTLDFWLNAVIKSKIQGGGREAAINGLRQQIEMNQDVAAAARARQSAITVEVCKRCWISTAYRDALDAAFNGADI